MASQSTNSDVDVVGVVVIVDDEGANDVDPSMVGEVVGVMVGSVLFLQIQVGVTNCGRKEH